MSIIVIAYFIFCIFTAFTFIASCAKLPNMAKYKTIEVKTFPLAPDYSGDPIFEFREFTAAFEKRSIELYHYITSRLSANYSISDYPTRTNFLLPNEERVYIHVSTVYVSPDDTLRILMSGDPDEPDDVELFLQTSAT